MSEDFPYPMECLKCGVVSKHDIKLEFNGQEFQLPCPAPCGHNNQVKLYSYRRETA